MNRCVVFSSISLPALSVVKSKVGNLEDLHIVSEYVKSQFFLKLIMPEIKKIGRAHTSRDRLHRNFD